MDQPFTYEHLSEEFSYEDEDLAQTLSCICINLVRDQHYDDSIEMTVNVYGEENPYEAPIISEVICDPESYLGRYFYKSSVCPRCLLRLFDDNVINLLIRKGLKLNWNPEWEATAATIDPANLHLTQKLCAELR